MSRTNRSLGKHLAELGAEIDCARTRERKFLRELRGLLSQIPHHFVISLPLRWVETPSTVSAGACSTTSPGTGTVLNNLFTMAVTVLRQQPGCTPSPSPDPCDKKSSSSSSRNRNRGSNPSAKTSKSKTSDAPKLEGKSKKISVQPISAKSVSALYETFGLESKTAKKASKKTSTTSPLKGGSKSKSRNGSGSGGAGGNCDSCDDSTPGQTGSCPDSTDSDSCHEVCVKGCADCRHRPFPRLVPYALIFNITLTRLRGRLQKCNSTLNHTLGEDFMNSLEGKIRAAGIRVGGSGRRFLDMIPPIQTPVLNAYVGGFTSNLVATLDFKNRLIKLGRNAIQTVFSGPEQLFGVARQPARRAPSYLSYGLGKRNDQILTGNMEISFVVDLRLLRNLAQIAREERRFASSNNDVANGGQDLSAPNDNNDNSVSDDDNDANFEELL